MNGVDHIPGVTFHKRHGTPTNAFRYSIDYVMLEPDRTVRAPSLFGLNRRSLMSVRDRDHGGQPGAGRGATWVRDVLAAHAITVPGLDDGGRIVLLAQPRVLGHVFNPVSFWLIYANDGGLRVVIPEVSNTFGDRHSYLCHHPDLREISREDTLSSVKIFHVSPFQPVEGGYRFRFDIRDDRIGVWIDYRVEDGGLYATLTGPRRHLTNGAILRACLRRPLGSRRVLALIHWQAVKLWWKGARYRPRPVPPLDEVSR